MAGNVSTFNFILVFFVALGSFLYGFNSAIVGTVFGLPSFYEYFDLELTGPRLKFTNDILGCKIPFHGTMVLRWLIVFQLSMACTVGEA
jgi:hypothetical protein